MYFSFAENCLSMTQALDKHVSGQNAMEKGQFSLHLLPVMGIFSYANDFWIKGKTGCGIFSANVNRSTEIEDNLCLLRCLEWGWMK